MRRIERTRQFRRDYGREAKGRHRTILDAALASVLVVLAGDDCLDARYRDHPLHGEWKDLRDCHLRPDSLLIYQKSDAETLRLVRLGSHSELGLRSSLLQCPGTAKAGHGCVVA